jgi:hypothetical protein
MVVPATSLTVLRRVVLLIGLLALTGCEAIGLAAMAIVPPTKPAVYTIANRPTLIIVDDPKGLLRDPQLGLRAAARCAEVLQTEKIVTAFIDNKKLTELAAELGDKYAKTSPYTIGKRLGAQQVILINVFAASVSPEPALMRPAAELGVKIFDVDAKERLFPPSSKATGVPDSTGTDGFYIHKVAMRFKVTEANPQRVYAIAFEKLAEEIGEGTALLFFEHDPTKYEDIRTGG